MKNETIITEEGVTITMTYDPSKVWNDRKEYTQYMKTAKMTVGEMLKEFHETFKVERNWDSVFTAIKLVHEEYNEWLDSNTDENELKEVADLVYVLYGLADKSGWDLDEAVRRVHISNMSKLDDNGQPILREDGKILKGPNYKPADLSDLV